MNTTSTRSNRRCFLRDTAGTLALAGLLGCHSPNNRAPAGVSRARLSRAEIARTVAEIERLAADYAGVPREDGAFLRLLVAASRATGVLEIGTAFGISAMWMALGLDETGGQLTTIDRDADRLAQARGNLAETRLADRVEFLLGDAHAVVPTLTGPFDFVLLRADKEGQVDYFQKLFPAKLTPSALLLTNGALSLAKWMPEYLALVQAHSDFDTVVLRTTAEDGFVVSRRRP